MGRNHSYRPESRGSAATLDAISLGSVAACVVATPTLVPQGPAPPTAKGHDMSPWSFMDPPNGQSI